MNLPRLGVFIGICLMLTGGLAYGQSGGADEVVPGAGDPVGGGQSDPVGGPSGDPAPAPKIPRTMVDRASITLDGSALAKGEIVVVVETSTGKSHEARIGVVAKMRDKEIAQILARDLQYAMSKDLDFKVSGNRIKIGRVSKDKTTTFTVRIVGWTVFDVGFIVERN